MMLQSGSILSGILILALVADGALTIKVLKQGGRELNPVLSFMIRKLGLCRAMITSRGFAVGLVAVFWIEQQASFLFGLLIPTVIFVACSAYSLVRSGEMIPGNEARTRHFGCSS
jgi:hypothetical protein